MIVKALAQVFSKGRYVLLAIIIALVTFVLTTWAGNLGLVWQIITSEGLLFASKVQILVALIGSIRTNFTIFSGGTAIGIAILFGLNVAVIVYDFRQRRLNPTQSRPAMSAMSLGGLVSGLFGIGCAACGGVLLSPALGFIGAGTLVAVLPFGGEEFGALGVGILTLSLFLSARRIGQSTICEISASPNYLQQ